MEEDIILNEPMASGFATDLGFLILFLPLISFVLLFFFGRVLPRYGDWLATGIMGVNTALSLVLFVTQWDSAPDMARMTWISLHNMETPLVISFSLMINDASVVMLVVVSLISFLVHMYSMDYMVGKRNYLRYFPYLALFTFSMLGIVLSNNLFLTFLFWELVGLSSFLLIGFWFEKESAQNASRKAFLYNRIGDAGFLVALMILWSEYRTLEISDLQLSAPGVTSMLTFAGFGFFLAATGKSAQFPLMNWLPDAMEGPTPVSALLHAATMVAAGVYLLTKVFFLLTFPVLVTIAVTGALTAFLAGFSALAQIDVKKVLAFSTISQLGYMMMGIGVGAYDAALFHLLTHAFFKACLFLSIGVVINAMHHVHKKMFDQGNYLNFNMLDMRHMGGLRKQLPVTFWCYTISAAALVGLPFFSGFLSKDAILLRSWEWAQLSEHGDYQALLYIVPVMGFVTVFLTGFYMARQFFMVFWGRFRLGTLHAMADDALRGVREVPFLMRIPLVVLACFSVWILYSWNPLDGRNGWFLQEISPSGIVPHGTEYHLPVMMVSLLLAGCGIFFAKSIYTRWKYKAGSWEDRAVSILKPVVPLSTNQWYLDKAATFLVVLPVLKISHFIVFVDRKVLDGAVNRFAVINVTLAHLLGWLDKNIVDGVVRLVVGVTGAAGKLLRGFQTGKVQGYIVAVIFILSIILFFFIMF